MTEPMDLRTPLPDAAHESLRQAVVRALDELRDAWLLLLATNSGMQGTLNTVQAGQETLGQVQQRIDAVNLRLDAGLTRDTTAQSGIDDLQRRVAALEQKVLTLNLGVRL